MAQGPGLGGNARKLRIDTQLGWHVKNRKAKGLTSGSSPTIPVGMGLETRHVSRPRFPRLSNENVSTCPASIPASLHLNSQRVDVIGTLSTVRRVISGELSGVSCGIRLRGYLGLD